MTEAPSRIRLLLVEDSELDAELVVDEIARDGFVIDWRRVEDERAFNQALAEFQPEIIISDLSMPDFSGYRALDIARDRVPDVPFLFVSGTMGEDSAVEAVRRGARDYLTKPVDAEQILAAFERDQDADAAVPDTTPSLARVEWEHIQRILNDCGGNISQAARTIGIHRRSLQRKLAKLPPLE